MVAIREADLASPAGWPQVAAALVADLGFRLIGDGSDGAREGHLIVALRERPTLRHFDPESIAFYAPVAGGSAIARVHRLRAGERADRVVAWGHLHVVDRIPVENRFLTFGGQLRLAGLDDEVTIAHFRSPVPIVRWGGHSQGTDSLAGAIGAFFGRLIVPVDFTCGAAARIGGVSPKVLYAAFLADEVRRRHAAAEHGVEPTALDDWLAAAWARARLDVPGCSEAEKLLAELHL